MLARLDLVIRGLYFERVHFLAFIEMAFKAQEKDNGHYAYELVKQRGSLILADGQNYSHLSPSGTAKGSGERREKYLKHM